MRLLWFYWYATNTLTKTLRAVIRNLYLSVIIYNRKIYLSIKKHKKIYINKHILMITNKWKNTVLYIETSITILFLYLLHLYRFIINDATH